MRMGRELFALLGLLCNGFVDMRWYSYPNKGAKLGYPTVAKKPCQDIKVGFLVVFARDEGGKGPRGEGKHVENFWQRR